MKKEEALEQIRKWDFLDDTEKEALATLIPELRESEDERLRKLLVWQVHRNIEDETNDLAGSVYDGIKGHDPDLEESIEDWKKCLAYLEKQKEREMPDSTGLIELWGEEKEILREKDFRGDGWRLAQNAFMDGVARGYGIKQKEQKRDEGDFTIYHPLKNGKGEYECIPYSFYGSLTSFSEDKDLIDFLRICFYTEEECKEWIEQQKEQKRSCNNLDDEIQRFFDECIEVHDAKIYGVDERVITVDCYELTARHFAQWQKEQKPAENDTRAKIISRATSEKQVVLLSESNGDAEIGWDTRSLEDAKNLLEYGLAFINREIERIAGLGSGPDYATTEGRYSHLFKQQEQPRWIWRRPLMSIIKMRILGHRKQ